MSKLTESELASLQRGWKDKLIELENEFTSRAYQTFSFSILPYLSIVSSDPEQLFIPDKPLLNRQEVSLGFQKTSTDFSTFSSFWFL